MPAVLATLIVLVVLTAAISLAILHWQYRNWPPYEWKQRVLRHVADLHARRRRLTAQDVDDPHTQAERLADDLFRRHLRTISAHHLDDYPGIGPNTVERVRSAGGRTLNDLTHFPFESIHGIGPSKAADLRAAVATLIREAKARFDADGCPEAEEYRRELAGVKAKAVERAAARQRETAAVEAALRSANELVAAAEDVTFINYLFRRTTAGPTDETMSRPLPTPSVAAPPVPAAKAAARPVPPPVPVARPAVARSGPPPTAFPPNPTGNAAPRPVDLFQAELAAAEPGSASSAGDHPWLPKLVAFTRFAFGVAKADGRVAQAEKKVIRSFLEEQFGQDPVLVRHIDPLMERIGARVPSEGEALAGVRSVTNENERRDLYRLAERVADASGPRNQREQDLLARVAAAFGLGMQTTPRCATGVSPVREQTTGETPVAHDPRLDLEIDPGTDVTPELVRRRYAMLTDKLDPTKAAALGPEFARMAAEKRDRLRAAAEALLAPFGEPLDKLAPPPPADLRHNPDLDAVFDM